MKKNDNPFVVNKNKIRKFNLKYPLLQMILDDDLDRLERIQKLKKKKQNEIYT